MKFFGSVTKGLIGICLLLMIFTSTTMAQSIQEISQTKYYEIYFIKETPYYSKIGAEKELATIPAQPIPLPALERQGEWFSFQYGPNIRWVKLSSNTIYVRSIPEKIGDDQVSPHKYMYLHHPVTLYQAASPLSKRLFEIKPQRIEVLHVNGEWYEIKAGQSSAWLYGGNGYVTSTMGTKKIRITKSVKLYQYPNLYSKQMGELTNTPFETTAIYSTGNWYQIIENGNAYWINGNQDIILPIKSEFTEKQTTLNGNVGNTIFMSIPKGKELWDGWHSYTKEEQVEVISKRMVTEIRGPKERLFQTFIVRPTSYQKNNQFNHTITALDGNQSDLSTYLQGIFAEGKEIDLLQLASQTAMKKMGDTQKINVIIGVPLPVDRTGSKLTVSQLTEIVRKYIEEVNQRWAERNPDSLRLVGFYFVNEEVPDPIIPLVRSIADLVHLNGYKLYWAPYFGAANAEKWQSLGFDFTWPQPNYYFEKLRKVHPDEDMLGSSYTLALETGAGTMLEWDSKVRQDGYTSYLESYLTRGLEIGANRASILVYDSEGELESVLLKLNDEFEKKKIKIFDYLLQYNGMNTSAVKQKLFNRNGYSLYVNGYVKSFKTTPIFKTGTLYLPLRETIEYLGGSVGWDAKTKAISVSVLGQQFVLSSKLETINNTTMIPLVFIKEVLGLKTEWDEMNKSISIFTK